MARPCPIRINARAVLAKTGENETLDKNDDRIPSTGVGITIESEAIARDDVYTPNGLGLGEIAGGRNFVFEITQELFANFAWHEVLFAACAVERVDMGNVPTIKPSVNMCGENSYKPCTVEIAQEGGNVYRATNCVGTFSINADAGNRLFVTFSMRGNFVKPEDSTYTNLSIIDWGPPLLYRGAEITYDSDAAGETLDLTTCPSFTFTPSMEVANLPSGCTPDGGGINYPVGTGPAEFTFNGVLATKNSIDRVWDESTNPVDGRDMIAKLRDSSGSGLPRISMFDYTLKDPTLADQQGFEGYNLTFSSGDWLIEWAEQEVVADNPLTLTFENQAGFYWDPNALSSVDIDWGDGAGYQAQNVQAGAASMVYGDSDPKTVRVLIEAHEGKYAEICPDCQYATAINDFGTQIVGLGNPMDGWIPMDDPSVIMKTTITSWPNELPPQLTRAHALCAFATFTEAPDWDYSNIVNGDSMFSGCADLTSFTSDLNSLVNGDSMFAECAGLTSFTSDLSSLVNGDYMFSGCSSLTTFASDLSSLVNGDYMFDYCPNLTTFTSDLSSLVNGYRMFGDCSSLTEVNATMTGALEQADFMFAGCESFSQDISDWCVPLIPSKPAGFGAGAGFENQPELQPQWGEPC